MVGSVRDGVERARECEAAGRVAEGLEHDARGVTSSVV